MGGAATARERQAALRARRRKNNLNYIHVWASADQEQAIKTFLADPVANPLHVTGAPKEEGDGKYAVDHHDLVIAASNSALVKSARPSEQNDHYLPF